MPIKLTKEQFDALIVYIDAAIEDGKLDDLVSSTEKRQALEELEKVLT